MGDSDIRVSIKGFGLAWEGSPKAGGFHTSRGSSLVKDEEGAVGKNSQSSAAIGSLVRGGYVPEISDLGDGVQQESEDILDIVSGGPQS